MTDNIVFKAIDRCRCHLKGKLQLIGQTIEYAYSDSSPKKRWEVFLEDRQKLRSLCPNARLSMNREDQDTISVSIMLTL